MLKYALRYLWFYLRAGNAHTIHSPFVYQLYTQIIDTDSYFYDFDPIEQIRQQLLQDPTPLHLQDFGAGSKKINDTTRSIATIARHSACTPKKARLLFRLVHHFKPSTILELGTSLGISTLYIAKASEATTRIFTLEGSEALAKQAKENFKKIDVESIESIIGNIDTTLHTTLKNIEQLDFVFIDANHRKEPTLNYFHTLLQKAHHDTVFVFDDIHWSDEMIQAWQQIQQHDKVTVSIDLFWFGLVFFRKEQPKQHFKLRF